jgi:hypothetical protein
MMGRWVKREASFESDVKRFAPILKKYREFLPKIVPLRNQRRRIKE